MGVQKKAQNAQNASVNKTQTNKPVANAINEALTTQSTVATETRNKSTINAPVAIVHAFCDNVKNDIVSGKLTRAMVLKRLIAAGINLHTAQTQYAKWARTNGVSSSRGVLTTEQIAALVAKI